MMLITLKYITSTYVLRASNISNANQHSCIDGRISTYEIIRIYIQSNVFRLLHTHTHAAKYLPGRAQRVEKRASREEDEFDNRQDAACDLTSDGLLLMTFRRDFSLEYGLFKHNTV